MDFITWVSLAIMPFSFSSIVLQSKKVTDSFITTHYLCKITKSVYGNCYGKAAPKKRGHSLKVFTLKGRKVTTYSVVVNIGWVYITLLSFYLNCA